MKSSCANICAGGTSLVVCCLVAVCFLNSVPPLRSSHLKLVSLPGFAASYHTNANCEHRDHSERLHITEPAAVNEEVVVIDEAALRDLPALSAKLTTSRSKLKVIEFVGPEVNDSAVRSLLKEIGKFDDYFFPSLSAVVLDSTSVTNEMAGDLLCIFRFRHVIISERYILQQLDGPQGFVKVDELDLPGFRQSVINNGVSKDHLRTTWFFRNYPVESLAPIDGVREVKADVLRQVGSLRSLSTVQLAGPEVNNDVVSRFRLDSVSSFSVHDTDVNGDWLKFLSPEVRILSVGHSSRSAGETDWHQLARLNALNYLALTGTRFSNEDLEVLSRLPDLEWLSLVKNDITTDGLKSVLGKLRKVKWLSVSPDIEVEKIRNHAIQLGLQLEIVVDSGFGEK